MLFSNLSKKLERLASELARHVPLKFFGTVLHDLVSIFIFDKLVMQLYVLLKNDTLKLVFSIGVIFGPSYNSLLRKHNIQVFLDQTEISLK